MKSGKIATVGTFDGVHTGHKYLLNELIRYGEQLHLQPLALILDPHPLRLVKPEAVPPLLSSFEQRKSAVSAMGVEACSLCFTEQMRSETSEMFMLRLRDEMGVKAMLIGHDNRFGSDRNSTFADYQRVGKQLGIDVYEAASLPGVSSSIVRKTLLRGDIETGNKLLGYTYSIVGEVIGGRRLGRTLGFPTANLQPLRKDGLLPPAGVYATFVSIEDVPTLLCAMTNIGYRPTVADSDNSISIETHIFNYSGNLYGQQVRLYFVSRMRAEMQFPSLEALRARLHEDKTQAQAILMKHSTF